MFLLLVVQLAISTWASQVAVSNDRMNTDKSTKIVLKDDLEKAEQKINELNQTLSCATDEDCEAIGVGYKECGGPYRYIVASKKSATFQELNKTIQRHYIQGKSYSNFHHLGSTCDVPSKPYGNCQENVCKATIPAVVEKTIHSIPPGATISIETRIQSAEALKKIWRKNPFITLQEPPIIDFSKFDLIPWNFCQKEANGIFYFRLGQVGDAGHKLVVDYSKINGCTQVDPSTCEIQLATIPKKETIITVHEGVQNCGNKRK